jgi:hypothetical protein
MLPTNGPGVGGTSMTLTPLDTPAAVREHARSGLGRFTAKTAVIAAAVTISLWIIIGQIFDRVDDIVADAIAQLQAATQLSGSAFLARLEKGLDWVADNDLSPERREKLVSDIHIIATRYRPLVVEASPLFSGVLSTETATERK